MGISSMAKGFNEMTFNLDKDDVLILYSDCIRESTYSRDEQYGLDRLIASFQKTSGMKAQEILSAILSMN